MAITDFIKKNPIKSILGLGLAGLVITTTAKDNVHFGSVTLNNPQENHYTWGLAPNTTLIGNSINGNFTTIGLLFAGNTVTPESIVSGNMTCIGIMGSGNVAEEASKITGNMHSYGFFISSNILKQGSAVTGNLDARGILANGISGLEIGTSGHVGLKDYIGQKK